MIMIDV